MVRYEWRITNKDLSWWGYWDNVKREYLIETTAIGKEVYEKLGFEEG